MKTAMLKNRQICLSVVATVIAFGLVVAAAPATTVILNVLDDDNEGFKDNSVVMPVTGNDGRTLGQQRLNAAQAAADSWGAILDSPVPIVVDISMDPLFCDPNLGAFGGAFELEHQPGVVLEHFLRLGVERLLELGLLFRRKATLVVHESPTFLYAVPRR